MELCDTIHYNDVWMVIAVSNRTDIRAGEHFVFRRSDGINKSMRPFGISKLDRIKAKHNGTYTYPRTDMHVQDHALSRGTWNIVRVPRRTKSRMQLRLLSLLRMINSERQNVVTVSQNRSSYILVPESPTLKQGKVCPSDVDDGRIIKINKP